MNLTKDDLIPLVHSRRYCALLISLKRDELIALLDDKKFFLCTSLKAGKAVFGNLSKFLKASFAL